MVTLDIEVCHSMEGYPLEDVEFTFAGETKVTDAKGKCIFNNINPGVYDFRVFKDGYGCHVFRPDEIKSTPDVQDIKFGIPENNYLKLSADKTKIKKNETVTIVAQLFKRDEIVTGIKQVSFSINGTQKVIADFDTDKEIAVMTLKGSNQGKVQITAITQFRTHDYTNVYSNVLVIQDGDEE